MRAHTFVYDADCGLCTRAADRLRSMTGGAVAFAGASPRDGLPSLGLTPGDIATAAWLVRDDGRRWSGHLAIGRALMLAGGWPRALGRVLCARPLDPVARRAYAWVARNRGRLGRAPSCQDLER